MGSFNYSDNFSGFNDLINRASVLTEAKRSPYEKYHPGFGSVTKELKSAGFSSAPLDTINFIRTVLYDLNIIDDDELAAAKRGSGFSAKKNNLLAVLDTKETEIANKTDEIAAAVKDGLAQYINRATTNRGREEKYAAQAAASKLAKDIKAGVDVGDAVDDTVGELDAAATELSDSIQLSKEDPTTFIEIKIRDADRVDDVSEIVTKYANEDGVEVSGDTVQFSVDPGTPLYKAVSAHGIDKIEAALKRDVDKISDSVVVVMAPDEDYEQIDDKEGEGPSMANYPGGAPGSYAMGEEGGGITEVEDNEDWIQGAVKGIKKKGTKGALTRAAKAAGESMSEYCASPPSKLAKKRCQFRANVSDEEDDEFNGLELDVFTTEEQPEDYIPDHDYEEILDDLVNKDKTEYALKKLNEQILLEGALGKWAGKLEKAIAKGPGFARGTADIIKSAANIAETIGGTFGKAWDWVMPKLDAAGEGVFGDEIWNASVYDVGTYLLDAYKKHKEEKGDLDTSQPMAPEGDWSIDPSPMLDSYQTSTAGYLTEQAASDKRNKKSEVKNQSFRERYKPKTNRQLEELRRYGL